MIRHVAVCALWFIPVLSIAQISSSISVDPSQFLQSGILLGTGWERHYSLRMQALGGDFSGIIEDQLTDLYRNPAFFAKVDQPMVMGELVRPYYSKEPASKMRVNPGQLSNGGYNSPENLQSSTGLRCAYLSHLGVLVRTNYSASQSANNDLSNEIDPWQSGGELRSVLNRSTNDHKSTFYNLQMSYGLSLDDGVVAGISYSFGRYQSDDAADILTGRSTNVPRTALAESDSIWSYNDDATTIDDRLNSHTFRLGLRWENTDNRVEAIGTVEFLKGTTDQAKRHDYAMYESYRIDTTRPYVYYRERFEHVESKQNIKGMNIGIDVRYHRLLTDRKTFTAHLGGRVAFFSSDATQRGALQSVDTSGRYEIYGMSALQRRIKVASPDDGFGFQVNAGAGWTYPVEPFLLAAGASVNVGHLAFDYIAQRSQTDTLHRWINSRDSLVFGQASVTAPAHCNRVFILRIAAPIAMEVEALKDFHVRAGWVPQYVRNVNKDESVDNGFRKTSDNLDVSTMTFGLGYRVFEKLWIDMANWGDIAQPRTWNIAAQYTF